MAINRASEIRDHLAKNFPEIDAGLRGRIVKSFAGSGKAIDDISPDRLFANADMTALKGAISAAESAKIDKNRIPTLARIKATLLRWNYPWSDTATINLQKLDACADGRDVTERLAIKADMRRCQLLPRYN